MSRMWRWKPALEKAPRSQLIPISFGHAGIDLCHFPLLSAASAFRSLSWIAAAAASDGIATRPVCQAPPPRRQQSAYCGPSPCRRFFHEATDQHASVERRPLICPNETALLPPRAAEDDANATIFTRPYPQAPAADAIRLATHPDTRQSAGRPGPPVWGPSSLWSRASYGYVREARVGPCR